VVGELDASTFFGLTGWLSDEEGESVPKGVTKVMMAQHLAIAGLEGVTELMQAQIGGMLMGAFVAKDLMDKQEVEEWVEHIEKLLFYAQGGVEGTMDVLPPLGRAMWYYLKAQAIMVCVYKRYWGVKTYVKVEGNEKIPERADVGVCTLLEAPECREYDKCNSMVEFWDR